MAWFEKFIWFITNENYLVIGGRDATQNELLIKKYLKPGDAFVNADMDGSAVVIVKQMPVGPGAPLFVDAEHPIPPTTLLQAGHLSVCQSRAWEAKIVTSAFWVHSHQVSKTGQNGHELSLGAFTIRGKKDFLPPIQLIYGIGNNIDLTLALLFETDESCIERHYWERRPWGRDGTTTITEEVERDNEKNGTEEGGLDIKSDEDLAGENSENENIKIDQEPVSEEEVAFPDTHIDIVYDFQIIPSLPLEDELGVVVNHTTHKRMSAKERRDTKKGQVDSFEVSTSVSTSLEDIISSPASETVNENKTAVPRGKRGKAKVKLFSFRK